MVGEPESLEGISTGVLCSKDEDYNTDECQYDGTESSHGEEEPIKEGWQVVCAVVHFTEDATEIAGSLSRDVVEVETMANAVCYSEQESCGPVKATILWNEM